MKVQKFIKAKITKTYWMSVLTIQQTFFHKNMNFSKKKINNKLKIIFNN